MACDATRAESQEDNKPKELSLDYVKKIISHQPKLGTNPFGTLYEGTDDGGRQMIVKILAEHENITALRREEAFSNEIQNITVLEPHENIVKLVGHYAAPKKANNEASSADEDGIERAICYEYLHKRSLPNSGEYDSIEWSKRLKIIKGVCQGLQLVHKHNIVHMDLKPENIWLDKDMVPKIVNFGLSVLIEEGRSEKRTDKLVGSIGYIAPEYAFNGEISARTDIYSLGLVIIEITTGEENPRMKNDGSARKYIDNICNDWTEEHIASNYPSLDADCLQQVNACIKIGLECVEINPANRPSIDKVVEKLDARCAS